MAEAAAFIMDTMQAVMIRETDMIRRIKAVTGMTVRMIIIRKHKRCCRSILQYQKFRKMQDKQQEEIEKWIFYR